MGWRLARTTWAMAGAGLALLVITGIGLGTEPEVQLKVDEHGNIIRVQGPTVPQPPPSMDPDVPPPPSQIPDAPPPTADIPAPPPRAGSSQGANITPTAAQQAGGDAVVQPRLPQTGSPGAEPTSTVSVAATQIPQVINAKDIGELLAKSTEAVGVQVQLRNPIVSDPRIRGLRSSQYLMYGDNALFFPVRLDLDTPVTRFDPGSVRDVIIVKGPYSARYGPGLSVLDVATLDSPRYQNGFEAHGRTSLGYQTNGQRWDGLQSLWAGDSDWGFRITYDILQGNDYRAGNGERIPGSYNSNNFNWAMGLDLTPQSSLEFKGLRVFQNDLEFPGLYFDVATFDTEAYSLRYTLRNQGIMDQLVLDTWYNTSVGTGNTAADPKQGFVQKLLAVSFNPGAFNRSSYIGPNGTPLFPGLSPMTPIGQAEQIAMMQGGNPLNLFQDFSDTRFASSSLGYRLFADWGDRETGLLTTGTDLRVLGQGLRENIMFNQVAGRNLNTGEVIRPGQAATFMQNQSIPDSNWVNPGLFAELELPMTDRLRLRSGGRMDWVRASTNQRLISGNIDLFGPPGPQFQQSRFEVDPTIYSTSPFDTNNVRNFYLLAGYVQSEYKLTEEMTGIFSFGHAQRAPNMTELYSTGPFIGILQQGTSRLIGDPNLKSEKLTQFDIGLQADYGWFQGGAGAFFGWVNDYITFDQNNGGPGLTQVVFTNTDLATLAGTELYGQMQMTDWLTSFGVLSYVQGIDQTHSDRRRSRDLASSRRNDPTTGQFASSTEPLPQIPPLESLVGFRIHEPTPERRWQVEFSARVVAGQNNFAKSLGEFPTPGFTIFNVRTYWQATEQLLLTAGVENIGDKLYREHLDPISGNLIGMAPFFRPGTNFYFGTQFTY